MTGDELQARQFSVVPQILVRPAHVPVPAQARHGHRGHAELPVRRPRRYRPGLWNRQGGPRHAGGGRSLCDHSADPEPRHLEGFGGDLHGRWRLWQRLLHGPRLLPGGVQGHLRVLRPAQHQGLCIAYAANSDPENECAGFSMATGTGGSGGKGGAAVAGGAGGAKADAGAPRDASASDAEPINLTRRRHRGYRQQLRREVQRHEGSAPLRRRGPAAASRSATRARILAQPDSATATEAAASVSRAAPAATPATSRARTAAPTAAPTRLPGGVLLQRHLEHVRRDQGRRAHLRHGCRVHEQSLRRCRRNRRLLQHRLRLAEQLQQLGLGR